MTDLKKTNKELQKLLDLFYPVGKLPAGGVRRVAYTKEEDQMHMIFREYASSHGLFVWEDAFGNSFAANFPNDRVGYTLIGSHLDSVLEGGRYDGVVGVAAGLMVLLELKARKLDIPVVVAAFRCEESGNFGLCTVGSSLFTDTLDDKQMLIEGLDGRTLKECLLSFVSNPVMNTKMIGRYFELHIEQGRVLEDSGKQVGIVTAIAAPYRCMITLNGIADHSGATPMGLRRDALCAAAGIILDTEDMGKYESGYGSVATIGFSETHPNTINVVPGKVVLKADMRAIDDGSLLRMENGIKRIVERRCRERDISFKIEDLDRKRPAKLSKGQTQKLVKAAKAEEIPYMLMPSGAGHDAMKLTAVCPSAMLFIPCRNGISHSPDEYVDIEQIKDGIRVLLRTVID